MPTEHERTAQHPVMRLLMQAHRGETVYPDQIEDLRLDARARAAFDQALAKVRTDAAGHTDAEGNPAPVTADAAERYNRTERYAASIIAALPEHWEDRGTHQRRRAGLGDPDALAAVKAQDEGYNHIADQVDHGVSIR